MGDTSPPRSSDPPFPDLNIHAAVGLQASFRPVGTLKRVIRRYLLPCVLIMGVALGAAGLAYKQAKKTAFADTCTFQVLVHIAQQQPQSADFLDFYNRLGANEVSIALMSNPYIPVGRANKVEAGTLAANTTVLPISGLGIYSVRVLAKERASATQLANAMCDQIVADIKDHRANTLNAQISDLENRITGLQADLKRLSAIPPAKRTIEERATLQARQEALAGNTAQMASILSLPPDNVSTLIKATDAQAYDPRHLSKDLLIGLVAGLLVCFLYVLVGEIIAERREKLPEPPATVARAEPAREPQGR